MKSKKILIGLTLCLLFLFAAGAFSDEGDAARALEKDMQGAFDAYGKVKAYKGKAHMQERIRGKIKGTEIVKMVYRKKPKAMAIRWQDGGLNGGMKLSHVESRDGADRFQALPTGALGLAGVQTLGFDSKLVKYTYPHHHRPIDYHLGFVLKNSKGFFDQARKEGRLKMTCRGMVENRLLGRSMKLYELSVNAQKGQGFTYKRAELGFDSRTRLPLYVKTYDFDNNLYESYLWSAFDINPEIDPKVFVLKKE
jgi:outer membrane lipoprotein-sorting protein